MSRPLHAPLRTPALARRAARFVQAGVLSPIDLHVVDRVAHLAKVDDGDVLLALSLAVRAPRHGHVCADLWTLERSIAIEPLDGMDIEAPEWPTDVDAWVAAVEACAPLVRLPHEVERVTPFVLDGARLYLDRFFRQERRLAAALSARAAERAEIAEPGLLSAGLDALFDRGSVGAPPSIDRQRLACAVALLRRLAVVTGGPGTGKTTTVKKILALAFAQSRAAGGRDLRVALAAPTGKAAARLKEAIRGDLDALTTRLPRVLGTVVSVAEARRFLEGIEASTLHRLLGYRPPGSGDGRAAFRYGADDPLPVDLVVVDEASMIDFALMARLVDAVPERARLLLLGDRHQLASVEAGTVLRDLCGPGHGAPRVSREWAGVLREVAGIDVGPGEIEARGGGTAGLGDCLAHLDRNYRFRDDSGISAFAAACLREPFDPQAAVAVLADRERYPNVALVPHAPDAADGGLPVAARRELLEALRRHFDLLARGPAPGQTEEDHHLEALATFERYRVLVAHRHGRLGVERLNESIGRWLLEANVPGLRAGAGLHVGRPILVLRNDYDSRLFNGDIGLVVCRGDAAVGEEERVVAFRAVGGGVTYVPPSRLPEHETVYAMTIHKSQGSEFERVMVVLPERPSPILTRELVYTAVTRAREGLTVVGDAGLLAEALGRTVERASGLGELLWPVPD